MRKRAHSWGRPLSLVAMLVAGLMLSGSTPASADNASSRESRSQTTKKHRYQRVDRNGPRHGIQLHRRTPVLHVGQERYFWNRHLRAFVPRWWVDWKPGPRASHRFDFIDVYTGDRFPKLRKALRVLGKQPYPPVLEIVRDRQHRRDERRRGDRWDDD